jgi:hypothetical protein
VTTRIHRKTQGQKLSPGYCAHPRPVCFPFSGALSPVILRRGPRDGALRLILLYGGVGKDIAHEATDVGSAAPLEGDTEVKTNTLHRAILRRRNQRLTFPIQRLAA